MMQTCPSKIWIVKLDNHDYDYMSEWWIENSTGPMAFTTRNDANLAANNACRKYWKENPGSKKRGLPNVEVIEINIPNSDGETLGL